MDENRKFMLIAIPSAFFGFVILISVLTGSNPIDSLLLLIGQTAMYIGMLFIFGAPVFLLVVLVSVTWNEMVLAKASKDEGGPKRRLLSTGTKKKKRKGKGKGKGKARTKSASAAPDTRPAIKKAKG